MKKLKLAFWIIFIGFLGLLVYQNMSFFMETNMLKIDLGIYRNQTPDMTNGAIIASFVGIGVLIVLLFYFSSRYDGYKSKKTIKTLQETLENRTAEVAELKRQVEMLKETPEPEAPPDLPSEVQPDNDTEPEAQHKAVEAAPQTQ